MLFQREKAQWLSEHVSKTQKKGRKGKGIGSKAAYNSSISNPSWPTGWYWSSPGKYLLLLIYGSDPMDLQLLLSSFRKVALEEKWLNMH